MDSNSNYYATTESGGTFNISNEYNCPTPTSQVYLYAIGGDAGSGTNSAAGLMAALGTCGTLSSSTSVVINEVSTVATAYSIAGFATDATHVSFFQQRDCSYRPCGRFRCGCQSRVTQHRQCAFNNTCWKRNCTDYGDQYTCRHSCGVRKQLGIRVDRLHYVILEREKRDHGPVGNRDGGNQYRAQPGIEPREPYSSGYGDVPVPAHTHRRTE